MGSVKAQLRFVFSTDQSPSRADSGHAKPDSHRRSERWIHHSLVGVIS
jgi:hypothetical protein